MSVAGDDRRDGAVEVKDEVVRSVENSLLSTRWESRNEAAHVATEPSVVVAKAVATSVKPVETAAMPLSDANERENRRVGVR